jgi:hypothetical protein
LRDDIRCRDNAADGRTSAAGRFGGDMPVHYILLAKCVLRTDTQVIGLVGDDFIINPTYSR